MGAKSSIYSNIKMIIFKLVSFGFKKNLGSEFSKFYFRGSKFKKKLYIIFILGLGQGVQKTIYHTFSL